MLKKILLGLVVLIAGILGMAALQPDEFRVERSLTISAPADRLFAQVNDVKKFQEWSPWAKLDPNAKTSFTPQTEGVGASLSWDGNDEVGQGRMTAIESRPQELVRFHMDFMRPMQATATAEFIVKPEGNGTHVTWALYGHKTYVCKLFGMIFNTDEMVGASFEKGLNNLKQRVEGQTP